MAPNFQNLSTLKHLFSDHQKQTKKARVDMTKFGDIDRQAARFGYCFAKDRNCFFDLVCRRGSNQRYFDGATQTIFRDGEANISSATRTTPNFSEHERQHAREHQTQQNQAVLQVPAPQIGFLLYSPKPFEAKLTDEEGARFKRPA